MERKLYPPKTDCSRPPSPINVYVDLSGLNSHATVGQGFQTVRELRSAYLQGLLSELRLHSFRPQWSCRTVKAIFLNCTELRDIPVGTLRALVYSIISSFRVDPALEIGIKLSASREAYNKVELLARAGFNRLLIDRSSASVQSGQAPFSPRAVAVNYDQLLSKACQVGFKSVESNCVISNEPELRESFREDLAAIARALPEIVRVLAARGLNSTSTEVEQYLRAADDFLGVLGYVRHSQTDYALDGFKPKYDLLNSPSEDFLGLGLGAFSRFRDSDGGHFISLNVSAVNHYLSKLAERVLPCWSRSYLLTDLVSEYVSCNLRSKSGLNLDKFKERFGFRLEQYLPGLIPALADSDYVQMVGKSVRLSLKGALVAENVVRSFMIENEELERAVG